MPSIHNQVKAQILNGTLVLHRGNNPAGPKGAAPIMGEPSGQIWEGNPGRIVTGM
ncbi:MAG: hypothetical protein GY703_06085 [Gammaproteobacteria bacterium]|nr:hypothetical protein [Gammaproteobacteria bacterium]